MAKPALNALRAFEVAARHESFVAAAEELSLTPAAISHRIKDLETTLEVMLFDRMARGVVLTDAGRRYFLEISSALRRIDLATADLARASVDGPLRVSVPQSFGQMWLAPRLHTLASIYPGLDLQINGSNALADLNKSEADVAIRFGMGTYAGLDAQLLMGDGIAILASADRVSAERDSRLPTLLDRLTLLEDAWVGPEEPWMTWTPWLREAGVSRGDVHRRIRFSDSGLAIASCLAGAGVCLARISIAFDYLQRRQLAALTSWRASEFAYFLITRPDETDSPRVTVFRDWLLAEVRRFAEKAVAVSGLGLDARSSQA